MLRADREIAISATLAEWAFDEVSRMVKLYRNRILNGKVGASLP